MDQKLKPLAMMSGFDNLRRKQLLSDFTVKIGEHAFKVHKTVLAASSDYFEAMFCNETIEMAQDEVTLPDMELGIWEAVSDFCYTGETEFSSQNVTELLLAASRLQIATLQEACCRYIEKNIDDDNCLSFLSLAERIRLDRLLEVALTYCCANFGVVTASPEFGLIGIEELKRIISDDRLAVLKESDVLAAAISWVAHDEPDRKRYLDDLLPLVRFALLDPASLVDASSDNLLRNSPVGRSLIEDAKNYHILRDHPDKLKSIQGRLNTEPRQGCDSLLGESLYILGGNILRTIDEGPPETNEPAMYSSIQRYNPISCTWTDLDVQINRSAYGCAYLNGSIYVVGGLDEYANTCLRIDLKSSVMIHHDVPALEEPLTYLRAVTLNGLIYALGGMGAKQRITDQVHVYDPSTGFWSDHQWPMAVGRHSYGATAHKGTIYYAGGSDSRGRACKEVFRMKDSGEFELVSEMILARSGFSLCSCRGTLYAVGGSGLGGKRLNVSEYYDEEHETWRLTSHMVRNHRRTEAIEVGGKIYAIENPDRFSLDNQEMEEITGKEITNPDSLVESYNFETRKWEWEPSLPGTGHDFGITKCSPKEDRST